jgi:hypothetical protein
MKNSYRTVLLFLLFLLFAKWMPLYSQALTVSYSSQLQFNLTDGTRSPGSTMQINISCTPGAQTCPTAATVYADFPVSCGLSAIGGGYSIPAPLVEAQVNGGAMIPFSSSVPPAYNGCGATLFTNVVLRPRGQTSLPVSMYIDLTNTSIPAAVMFQGSLRVTVETL